MSYETALRVEQSVSKKRWCIRPFQERLALALAQAFGLPDALGRLLAARGVSLEQADDFLNPTLRQGLPDPSHLLDMDTAVGRIVKAIQSGEQVAIFGDYDVDGATSSALLWRFLRQVGGKVQTYIPDRIEEGYGPNREAFAKLQSQGVKVIITVDCGTSAHEVLGESKQNGLEVIVIDHHIGPVKLPDTVALVNPNRLDESSPFTYLAAVGVSFLLAVGINRALRKAGWYETRPEPDLRRLLDLVALGTVCDVMPLKDLNRVFVHQGLKILSQRQNLGLKTLADVAGIRERPTAYHLGFVLGPRINAGGRVGEANLGTRLLCSEDPQEATQIAQRLHHFNEKRKEIEESVLAEAIRQAELQKDAAILMVSGNNWHPGVIGIVAGRLKEKFNRPACVISQDEQGLGKASGRSITGVDLGTMVQAAVEKGLLVAGGGHAMAAGFTVRMEKFSALCEFFAQRLNKTVMDAPQEFMLDGVLTPQAATLKWVLSLERLGPFGIGNPTPRFGFGRMRIIKADLVGTDHVRCQLADFAGKRLSGIAFRSADTELGQFLLNSNGAVCHVAGTLRINSWQGRDSVQLTIEDVAPERVDADLPLSA
ncbi:MAG: single-stranded-DNA-specific exonuclease RecJ [Pseudomonadota bacterium]